MNLIKTVIVYNITDLEIKIKIKIDAKNDYDDGRDDND